jgi:hypothetical protein
MLNLGLGTSKWPSPAFSWGAAEHGVALSAADGRPHVSAKALTDVASGRGIRVLDMPAES